MMCIIFILLFSMYEYNFLFVENNIILLYCFITQFWLLIFYEFISMSSDIISEA